MNELNAIYDSFVGKHILTTEENQNYNENILPEFLRNNDKYLFYDDMTGKVLLLSLCEMKEHYNKGNYRDADRLVESFDDFCALCCCEVLKEFSGYSFELICEEFIKHDLLKLYV